MKNRRILITIVVLALVVGSAYVFVSSRMLYQGELLELFPEDCLTFVVVRDLANRHREFRASSIFVHLQQSGFYQQWQEQTEAEGASFLRELPTKHGADMNLVLRLLGREFAVGIFPTRSPYYEYQVALVSRLSTQDQWLLQAFSLSGRDLPLDNLTREQLDGHEVYRWRFSSDLPALYFHVHRGILVAATKQYLLKRLLDNFSRVSLDRLTRKARYRELMPSGFARNFVTVGVFRLDWLLRHQGLSELAEFLQIKGFATNFDFGAAYTFSSRIIHSLDLPPISPRDNWRKSFRHRPCVPEGAFMYSESSLWLGLAATWQFPSLRANLEKQGIGDFTMLGGRFAAGLSNLDEVLPAVVFEFAPPDPAALARHIESGLPLMAALLKLDIAGQKDFFRSGSCEGSRVSVFPELPFAYALREGRLFTAFEEELLCRSLAAMPGEQALFAKFRSRLSGPSDLYSVCDWRAFLSALSANREKLTAWNPEAGPFIDILTAMDFVEGWVASLLLSEGVTEVQAEITFRPPR
jgi:hypothetical protein